jgi:hypothetical protein
VYEPATWVTIFTGDMGNTLGHRTREVGGGLERDLCHGRTNEVYR